MKVSDLRQHLADLARLLESSGAKGVAGDLAAVSAGLAPFHELPLKGFADFLVRAEAYSRGEVPLQLAGKRSGGGSTPKKPKTPPPDAAALGEQVQTFYEGAALPSVTREQLEELAVRLGPLKKDELVRISERIGLAGMKAKPKDRILEAIKERILARKAANQRAGLIDRPESGVGNGTGIQLFGTNRD